MKLSLFKFFCPFSIPQAKKLAILLLLFQVSLFKAAGQNAPAFVVTGKVTESSGETLVGASVKLKGTSTGTVTDVNGVFSITVSGPDPTLQFSSMGFVPTEEKVAGRRTINVQMITDAQSLNEVVVLGYGSVNRKNFSGAAATISTDDLPKAANTSVNALLQGRAAGVSVTQGSSQPGGQYNISIRGRGAPLYVIDGVPIFNNTSSEPAINSFSNSAEIGFGGGVARDPLNSINPADIESITILKDASTASIYGVAAANGVVLITTKKGKADGRVSTDFRTSTTLQTPKKYFEFLNATEFMKETNRFSRDLFLYNNNLPPYGTSTTTNVFVQPYSQTEIDNAGVGTDWVGMMIRNGLTTEHNIQISGGTDKTRIFTSFNYQGIKGAIQNSDTKIYRGRINLEQQITPQLQFALDLTLSQSNSQNASTGGGGAVEKYNSLQAAYAFSPAVGVYDSEGNFSKSSNTLLTNPMAFLIIDDNSRNGRVFAAPKLRYNPIKGLVLNLNGALDKSTTNRRFYLPKRSRNSQFPGGMAQISNNAVHNYNVEGFANYKTSIGSHALDFVLGAGYYTGFNESVSVQAVDFFTDAFSYNNIGVATNKDKSFMGSNRSADQNKISQWFRANYSYKSRYNLTISARRDGANVFAENKKWGIFPSISGNWNISEEEFFKNNVTAVSNLKLRASYASVGNIGNLNALALLSTNGGNYLIGNTYYSGVAQSQLANPDLTWETLWEKNLGLDIGLLRDRVTVSVDVYQRDRSNILRNVPLPVNNSISFISSNQGGRARDEGYEIAINSVNVRNSAFTWETGFNISHNQSRTLERSPYDAPLRPWQHLTDLNGTAYGWKSMGILRNNADKPAHMPNARLGNVLYQDINGDGLLNDLDIVYLGNSVPKWRIGFQNRFRYKNFDLTIDMYGTTRQWRANNLNDYSTATRLTTDRLNVTTNINEIWTVDNPNGTRPGVAANPYQGTAGNDFQVENVSFLRLRNLTLGYTFKPVSFIRNARVFVDFQNVALFTNYKGFDPEINEANPYPQVLQSTLSLQVSF